jgi:hypothetical protein
MFATEDTLEQELSGQWLLVKYHRFNVIQASTMDTFHNGDSPETGLSWNVPLLCQRRASLIQLAKPREICLSPV